MPFIHLPERGVNQYYCTNPTWHYSTSLSTYPTEGVLDPAKPTLFLIHNGGSSSGSQMHQFHDERLRNTFNMIALDASFHGWSTGAQRGRYTIEDAADNFLAALDELYGRIPFSVLGEGRLGSHCATFMAHKRPEQVQAIALASPCRIKEVPEKTAIMHEWLKGTEVNKNGKGDKTGLLPPDSLNFIYDYYFAGSSKDRERQAIFASAFQQRYGAGHTSHDAQHLIHWLDYPPLPAEDLAKIKIPVMILAGELDKFSPISAAEEWRDALTGVPGGVPIHVVKSAPHLLMYAEYAVANQLVLDFLKGALKL